VGNGSSTLRAARLPAVRSAGLVGGALQLSGGGLDHGDRRQLIRVSCRTDPGDPDPLSGFDRHALA